jgi:2-haloacid dehalogenase
MSQMNAVLLDLGGVLIDWNPRYLYAPLFGDRTAEMEDFLARICAPEWNHTMDAGKSFAEAVAERQQLYPEHAELIALWKDGWAQMLRDAIHDTVAVLAELRERGHRMVALTNWSAETFPVARARFDFLQWFEDIVVSGEVRLAKPDPRIFRLAIERNRLDPSRTLFIDDSLVNVEAARGTGLQAVHFRSAGALREDLVRLALL